MQPPGTDVFRVLVDSGCKAGDFLDSVIEEGQLDAFRFEQRDILFDQSILRFGQNPNEILDRQRIQFNANRETALKLGNQIRRFATWNAPAAMNRM